MDDGGPPEEPKFYRGEITILTENGLYGACHYTRFYSSEEEDEFKTAIMKGTLENSPIKAYRWHLKPFSSSFDNRHVWLEASRRRLPPLDLAKLQADLDRHAINLEDLTEE